MKFGVAIGTNMSIQEIGHISKVVEDSGFDYLTIVDTPSSSPDVHVGLTVAAMNTKRIQIGQGVVDPYTYKPVTIANIACTLHQLSQGRAFIGLGTAVRPLKEKKVSLQDLRESVNFLRHYMVGEEVEWNGRKLRLKWIKANIPIYLAAHGPKAMELAGEIADGVITLPCVNPEFAQWRQEQVIKGAERGARGIDEIDCWTRTMVYITDSRQSAWRELSAYPGSIRQLHKLLDRSDPVVIDLKNRLDRSYPGLVDELKQGSINFSRAYDPSYGERVDSPQSKTVTWPMIDFFHLVGTADEICAKIDKLHKIGVNTISMVAYTLLDMENMIKRVGQEIIPNFHG